MTPPQTVTLPLPATRATCNQPTAYPPARAHTAPPHPAHRPRSAAPARAGAVRGVSVSVPSPACADALARRGRRRAGRLPRRSRRPLHSLSGLAAPMMLLAFLAVVAALGILGYGVATSWELRRSRRQLPPRPGPGGHALDGEWHGGTGQDPVPPGHGERALPARECPTVSTGRPQARRAYRGIQPPPDAGYSSAPAPSFPHVTLKSVRRVPGYRSCSVGRISISLTATCRGRVTM